MTRTAFIILNLSLFGVIAVAQSEKKAVREGNKEFKKEDYVNAEISYRSALEMHPSNYKANFNLGDAIYKQEKYNEASQIFEDLSTLNLDPKDKARVYHNLGNSYFKQQNFGESVNAFKNALRNNPDDMATKYNLAQAQRMLMQQEQQQDKNSDGGEGENEEKKDEQQQEKKDEQDKKQNEKQQDQQKQEQQEQEQRISPEDAKRMLEAIQNNEQEIQDRVKEEQAKQQRVKVEKNW